MIGTIKLYRCRGKVYSKVTYKINVAAHSHADAERICRSWLKATDTKQIVQWEVKAVPMDNPVYAEVVSDGS